MFMFAYDNYLQHAYPLDELRPITCDGTDTWGSYSLTLIDALDTLAIMGNYTEFQRVVKLLIDDLTFDSDIEVSVFETNIRVIGGLLSAHLLSKQAGMAVNSDWPCSGPLLNLAENVAQRILPAFNTPTGMPYGTVNLQFGVPENETPITCTAGVGTFIIEFGTLSRLTGNPVYENIAMKALQSLWTTRSEIGLVGNHIDVKTGLWVALDSGIGAGVDSYLEYLVKGSFLLSNPALIDMYKEYSVSIKQYLKHDDWYMWANMKKGHVTMPIFQSLDAYLPGVQSLLGEIDDAMKTMHNYHQVWKQLGFIPEFYSIVNGFPVEKHEGYPLRPELVESAMYLYQATKDPFLLEVGRDILESIEQSAKTGCGYASIKDVRDHKLDNRMESFFLAETTKYLYLLFDADNFIHNDGSHGDIIDSPGGQCILNTGNYFFNTEAHPIDAAALNCCVARKQKNVKSVLQNLQGSNRDKYNQLKMLLKEENKELNNKSFTSRYNCTSQPFHRRLSVLGEMFVN
ncbi:ER degradation-enhancing alpha-mannosidase-like protein 2 [Saccoglossus kowalevskii]|uniref:alpha-1,2-Mannosidase n=1 Tax=Saccoglossus kowalevskii TaxID=10224 RepID=A0ABM0LXU2_SACKO|nr:PREDICTED: ER degradation-enhancing alpha-mannosidase-like protein 2-like [Saccoglossus kowalevskii]